MNPIASQIPVLVPASEGTSNLPSPVKPPSAGRSQSRFSSVLRSVHQENGRTNKAQSRGESQAQSADNADTRNPQTKRTDRQASQAQQALAQAADSSHDHAQETERTESSGSAQDEHGSDGNQAGTDITGTASQGVLLVLQQALASNTATPQQDMTPAQPTAAESESKDVSSLSTPEDHQATQDVVVPTVGPLSTFNHPEAMLILAATPAAPEGTVPLSNRQTEQLTTQQVITSDVQGQPTDEIQKEQIRPSDVVVHEEQSQQKDSAPVISKDAPSPQVSILSAQSSQSQHDQMPEDISGRLVANHTDIGVPQVQEIREPGPTPLRPLTTAREALQEEEVAPKNASTLPSGWASFSNLDEQADMQGADQQGNHHDRTETPLPQGPSEPVLHQQGSGSAQAATPFTVGNVIQPMPRSLETTLSPPTTPVQPTTASHDISDAPTPAMSRSVVFDVAQPDLGRISVRVAMTNDLVHTHISSDRSDIGQVLINGQDRLQAAFQASGLDMGQFRVDIDRQSAGRSFQQGQPHEQGQTWQQNSARSDSEQHSAESNDGRWSRSHGMLNLVA